MITKDLSTLKIHKLTQEQYDREFDAGNLDETAIYLTPDEEIDLSQYATVEQLNNKADSGHTHKINDISELQTTLNEISEKANESDMFVVTVTSSNVDGTVTYSADKTFEEIETAASEGKNVVISYNSYYYHMTAYNAGVLIMFSSAVRVGASTISTFLFNIKSNKISVSSQYVQESSKKINAISSSVSTNDYYPSVKAVVDYVDTQISEHKHSWNNLKDRPFYSEGGGEQIEIFNETVEYTNDIDEGYFITTPIALTDGEIYNVSLTNAEGVQYEVECKCYSVNVEDVNALILGNGALLGAPGIADNGEAFAITVIASQEFTISMLTLMDSTYTSPVKVVITQGEKEIIHKLPNKYLDMEWISTRKEVLLIDEIIVKQTSSFGGSVIIIDDTFFNNFIDSNGKKVIVCLDGERYETTIKVFNESGFIEDAVIFAGNASIYGSGMPNTGEPFVIQFGGSFTELVTKEAGEHTISVYELEPNPMPEEFLPNHIHSWNDLDDKPFYEETKKTVIIEEQTITFDNNSKAYPTVTGQYSIGTNVTILFDGIEYEAEVKNGFFLGDNYIISRFSTIDDIEITIVWDGFCIYANNSLTGNHTISVYIKETVIHKLPEEFLPEHTHSWNDLEDKPFGEILGYEICNKEQTFTVELSNDVRATADLQKDVDIDYSRVNLPTVVTLDGVEYTDLDIYESGGDMCIYIKFTNENGDNITIINNDSIYMPSSYAGTTHTIEIKQETKIVKTIDEKFLPDLATGGTFIVNITCDDDGKFLSDKTYDEIVEAHESGKFVQASLYGIIFPLIYLGDNGCEFRLDSEGSADSIFVSSNEGEVEVEEYYYLGETFGYFANNILIGALNTTDKTLVGAINEVNEKSCIEVTSGEPTKESTVLTINPSAEEINLYSAEEVDEKLDSKVNTPTTAEVGQILAVKAVDENGVPTEFEAVEMPSGGGSVRPDYNQNDETAKDYIKNRPFYTGDLVETVLFDGVVNIPEGTPGAAVDVYFEVVEGCNYTVVLDGVTYEVVGMLDGNGGTYIGSFSLWLDGKVVDGEPPFACGDREICIISGAGEHTLRISNILPEIHYIDPKYIKDMYYEYMVPNNDFITDSVVSVENDYDFVNIDTFWIDNYLVKDATYEVVFDEQTYTCVARTTSDGEIYIGNPALAIHNGLGGFSENIESNEPFFMYTFGEDDDYGLIIQTAGEHTIYIQGTGEKLTPKTINLKYIPDEIKAAITSNQSNINNIHGSINNLEDSKIDKKNPTGTGSFSMNRKAGSTIGTNSHAEGYSTTASGYSSHAEGYSTTASSTSSHAEGDGTTASNYCSHAEGNGTTASGTESHAEGEQTEASGQCSHTEGYMTKASKEASHAEGKQTEASGHYSHAEGYSTTASGQSSHAEGYDTLASGNYSHAEGYKTKATTTDDATTNIGRIPSDEKGWYTHAEGYGTVAYGTVSHAEGNGTKASGDNSHSEGYMTQSVGETSHAEGYQSIASGSYSHAEGCMTIAKGENQHVQGKFNIRDDEDKYAHIVGNGVSFTYRSNAHTLDWEGNAEYQGDVKANACGGETPISLVETAEAVKTKITSPTTAEVGQVLAVKTIDENGSPTEFKYDTLLSGWNDIEEPYLLDLVEEITLEEAVGYVEMTGLTGKEKIIYIEAEIQPIPNGGYIWVAEQSNGGKALYPNFTLSTTSITYYSLLLFRLHDNIFNIIAMNKHGSRCGAIQKTGTSGDCFSVGRGNSDSTTYNNAIQTLYVGTYATGGFLSGSKIKLFAK